MRATQTIAERRVRGKVALVCLITVVLLILLSSKASAGVVQESVASSEDAEWTHEPGYTAEPPTDLPATEAPGFVDAAAPQTRAQKTPPEYQQGTTAEEEEQTLAAATAIAMEETRKRIQEAVRQEEEAERARLAAEAVQHEAREEDMVHRIQEEAEQPVHVRLAEEARLTEEAKKLAEAQAAEEEAKRLAEAQAAEEEAKRLAEAQAAEEEAKRLAEAQAAEEKARAAQEARLSEEVRRLKAAEKARLAEETRLLNEAARQAEEALTAQGEAERLELEQQAEAARRAAEEKEAAARQLREQQGELDRLSQQQKDTVQEIQTSSEGYRIALAALEAREADELAAAQQREKLAASSFQQSIERELEALSQNLATLDARTAAVRDRLKETATPNKSLDVVLTHLNELFEDVDKASGALAAVHVTARSLKKAAKVAESSRGASNASAGPESFKERRSALAASHEAALARLQRQLQAIDAKMAELRHKLGLPTVDEEAKQNSRSVTGTAEAGTQAEVLTAALSSKPTLSQETTTVAPSLVTTSAPSSTLHPASGVDAAASTPSPASSTAPHSTPPPPQVNELRPNSSLQLLIRTLVQQAEEKGYNVSRYEVHRRENGVFFKAKGRLQIIGAMVLITLVSVVQTMRWCRGDRDDGHAEPGTATKAAAQKLSPAKAAPATAGAAQSKQDSTPSPAGQLETARDAFPPLKPSSGAAKRESSYGASSLRQRRFRDGASSSLAANCDPVQQLPDSSSGVPLSLPSPTDSPHTQLPTPMMPPPQGSAPTPVQHPSADVQGDSPNRFPAPPPSSLGGAAGRAASHSMMDIPPPPPPRRRRDAEDFELQNPFLSRWS
ncbi:hypothetical protein NQL31_005986 [Lotmaria passim]